MDLATVVEELVIFFGPMAMADSIDIKSYFPSDLPQVALDREMFKQALLNLLLNAQQAMPGGGEITIQAVRDGDSVVLHIIDTGNGMPPEHAAKAFRPFYTTRTGGSGLGLPTTRKIIEAHGGSIELQSEVGAGTRFTIRLPSVKTNG
jgi:signal transduction histidine kinase